MSTKTWTYLDGDWHEGATSLMTATTHAAWLGNTVFDGARRYDGVFPDLDRHCMRVVRSAEIMGMLPELEGETIAGLAKDGSRYFDEDEALYIRPMFWIEDGFGVIDPGSTRFSLVIQSIPMPDPETGFSACLSPYRKPLPDTAPTCAKASCLYPQLTMAWRDARKRGYDNAVMLDAGGYVAEFTMQNLFLVKENVVLTPAENGMLLPGITRLRAIELLQRIGYHVVECSVTLDDLRKASEIISTGNHAKILPCSSFEDHQTGVGSVGKKLVEAYREFAYSG